MLSDIPGIFNRLLQDIGRIVRNRGDEPPLFRWFILLPTQLLFLVFWPLTAFLAIVFASFSDVMNAWVIPENATHVPSFYVPKTDNLSAMVILPLFGIVFGGIHCLGWNLDYPSRTEKTIWRIASLTITLTPPISTLSFAKLSRLADETPHCRGKWGRAMDTIQSILAVTLFALIVFPPCVYLLARLFLLVEAFASLRHQPTTAFQSVN
jgi:hypothetical protein